MNFLSSLSRKLGFTGGDEDERSDELDENELEDDEEEDEEETGSRFAFRFPFGGSFRNSVQDAYDDEEEEEEDPAPVRQVPVSRTSSRRSGNVIHDNRMEQRAPEVQYTHCERIVNVRQIEECREIIKFLLRGESVMLNLENIDPKDCGRVVDLLSGAAFALQGRMVKVAHLSYLLAPENVEIIEEDVYTSTHNLRYNR